MRSGVPSYSLASQFQSPCISSATTTSSLAPVDGYSRGDPRPDRRRWLDVYAVCSGPTHSVARQVATVSPVFHVDNGRPIPRRHGGRTYPRADSPRVCTGCGVYGGVGVPGGASELARYGRVLDRASFRDRFCRSARSCDLLAIHSFRARASAGTTARGLLAALCLAGVLIAVWAYYLLRLGHSP